MKEVIQEPDLVTVLTEMISDIADPSTHYTVSANYYDHQTPERLGERWYIAQIWISQESAHNLALTDKGLICDIHLNRHDLAQVSRILLPYDQIWSVQRLSASKS